MDSMQLVHTYSLKQIAKKFPESNIDINNPFNSTGLSNSIAENKLAEQKSSDNSPQPSFFHQLISCSLCNGMRSQNQFQNLLPRTVSVIREGIEFTMDTLYIVVGDIVYLKPGMCLNFDARILAIKEPESEFQVDETDTHEQPKSTHKSADSSNAREWKEAPNMVLNGCRILEGNAYAIVVAKDM